MSSILNQFPTFHSPLHNFICVSEMVNKLFVVTQIVQGVFINRPGVAGAVLQLPPSLIH